MKNNHLRFNCLILMIIVLIISSCFVPEKFSVKVQIEKDGTYTFTYDGILTHVFARAAEVEGKLSSKDKKEMKKIESDFRKEPGFKKVKYIGKGRFKVLYEKTGSRDEPFFFLSKEINLFSIVFDKDKTIKITGFQIDKKSLTELEQIKVKIDGELEILTNASVLNHNSSIKPKKTGKMDIYKWKIKFNLDPAPYILLEYK